MAEPKLLSETSLQLERSIPAPPEAVSVPQRVSL